MSPFLSGKKITSTITDFQYTIINDHESIEKKYKKNNTQIGLDIKWGELSLCGL